MATSAYAKVVGGKLKLKGSAAPAAAKTGIAAPSTAAAAHAGSKRPREEATSIAGLAAAAAAAAARPAQEASRTLGTGTIVTSGASVHGIGTAFLREVAVGDAIEVSLPGPATGPAVIQEIRVVKMVLSDVSIGISKPFSTDVAAGAAFYVLKLSRAAEDPAALAAAAVAAKHAEEAKAFGTYASAGGTMFTYRERKAGAHGSYKVVTQALDSAVSREELLDMRATKKSDKYC